MLEDSLLFINLLIAVDMIACLHLTIHLLCCRCSVGHFICVGVQFTGWIWESTHIGWCQTTSWTGHLSTAHNNSQYLLFITLKITLKYYILIRKHLALCCIISQSYSFSNAIIWVKNAFVLTYASELPDA